RRRGPQRVSAGRTVKPVTNHPENRQKRTGSILALCMAMHTTAWHAVSSEKNTLTPVFRYRQGCVILGSLACS
ncbi:hypothetical protein FOT67_26525, partial [Citrobacter portucalensis]|nr:hypothetical protein [Citrobacter portucalensis]